MPVGGWEPSHRAPGSPSPDPPPHIGTTYRRVSLFPGCETKERHRDGCHWPRPKVTLAGPSPSFPFSMPTCKSPCMILWASIFLVKAQTGQRTRIVNFGAQSVLYHKISCLERDVVSRVRQGPWAWNCALGPIVQIGKLRSGRYDLG